MQVRLALLGAALCFCFASLASAQDAVKADPKHYTVLTENSRVRVLRAHYAPGEKSVMHSHPDEVAVFLTGGKARFTFPDGKTLDVSNKPGDVQYSAATTHLPENTGDKAFDVIVIELKTPAAKPHAAMKK